MLARIEAYFRRWRRRLSRSEWAIKHLGLRPSVGTSEEPGLLMIQIDGFSREQMERAVSKGHLPFLKRLIARDGYETHTFYPGLPTTTPAVQAELYYGVKSAVPAFSFLDRARGETGRMYYSEWAKACEAHCSDQAEGLLKGGSSWSNIYTGGAGQEESHFCAASIGLGDMWRTGKIRNIFVFMILNAPAAFKIAGLVLVELGVAFSDAVRGILHGRRPGIEFTSLASRAFIGVGLRELLTIGGTVDVARGLPIVHINFVGYDEHAHARGPGSLFAHWSLRGIDQSIKRLYQAAHQSNRRDYAVWIFSDHGQEFVRSYPIEHPGGIEAALRKSLDLSLRKDAAWRRRAPERPVLAWISRSRHGKSWMDRQAAAERERLKTMAATGEDPFTVAAMGPLGHVYFKQPITPAQARALASRLVHQSHVPGVIFRETNGDFVWMHGKGEARIPDEVPALLPHLDALRPQIARDLAGLCAHPNAGELILLGWSPWELPWSFAWEHGAHGGFGPHETQGFVLLPPHTRLPAESKDFIRPTALREAALHFLGREELDSVGTAVEAERQVRVITYNAHGCYGVDGRISPRRVARIIQAQAPDIVALQELDLGRRRSRAEDQAGLIARAVGMHFVFVPTVTRGEEHYGHALLSRFPIEVVKRALLPGVTRGYPREPRAALWARVNVGGRPLNLVTTHLGLGQRERVDQMNALLGEDWIGGIIAEEPVLICGDFNSVPGSEPYTLAAKALRDVQKPRALGSGKDRGSGRSRPLSTFSSFRPFLRIDHIFVSRHVATKLVSVPRNALTRLASDHLPLVADLEIEPAAVETTTHIAAAS